MQLHPEPHCCSLSQQEALRRLLYLRHQITFCFCTDAKYILKALLFFPLHSGNGASSKASIVQIVRVPLAPRRPPAGFITDAAVGSEWVKHLEWDFKCLHASSTGKERHTPNTLDLLLTRAGEEGRKPDHTFFKIKPAIAVNNATASCHSLCFFLSLCDYFLVKACVH